jgi:Coenzyme PQQ synthesis protein D (PqqD)
VSDGTPTTFARARATLWRRVGAEVLLAGAEGSQIDRLSVPASALWFRLERPRGRDELVADLAEEFDARPADIADHVDGLIEQLSDRGWIRRVGRAEGPDGADG